MIAVKLYDDSLRIDISLLHDDIIYTIKNLYLEGYTVVSSVNDIVVYGTGRELYNIISILSYYYNIYLV